MSELLDHLISVFFRVREYLLSTNPKYIIVGKNSKGDDTYDFDFESEKIIIEYLLKYYPISRILSEELGMINESLSEYDYTFVIDPVDGSKNYLNRIPIVGLSIAVIQGSNISTSTVSHGIIGNIYSGSYLIAERGKGTFLKERLIKSSDITPFDQSVVTCTINRFQAEQHLLFHAVNQVFNNIRSLGSSSIELSYVAQGITSAHYDFRKRLTAENFLAGALILEEMGGKLTDLYGNSIDNITNLSDGYSIIASHSGKNHRHFLEVLHNPNLYTREGS